MWLLSQKRIQCRVNLHRKHIVPNATCELCGEADESPEHIINGCHIARQFWTKLELTCLLGLMSVNYTNLTVLSMCQSKSLGPSLPSHAGKYGNGALFRSEQTSVQHLFGTCRSEAEQWRVRLSRKKRPIADAWCQLFQDAMAT